MKTQFGQPTIVRVGTHRDKNGKKWPWVREKRYFNRNKYAKVHKHPGVKS